MAPAQIAEAQKFAREWKVKPEETPGRNLHYGEIGDFGLANLSCWGGHRRAKFKEVEGGSKTRTHSGTLSI